MRNDAEALRLIEAVVRVLQAGYSPGRPAFYALGRVHEEVQRARRSLPPMASPDLPISDAAPRA